MPDRSSGGASDDDATARLETRFRRIARLDHASVFLDWDRMVVMPAGGAEPRAEALAEIAALRHELAADAAIGDWLDAADAALAEGVGEQSEAEAIGEQSEAESVGQRSEVAVERSGTAGERSEAVSGQHGSAAGQGRASGERIGAVTEQGAVSRGRPSGVPDELATRAASLREMRRAWRDASALPADLVRAQVTAGARCERGWREQRPANDWAGFLVNFRPVVALAREEADARRAAAPGRFGTRYDALLERHCAGDDQALVARVFDALRDRLPTLWQTVSERQADRPPLPAGRYPQDAQQRLSERIMARLGFDFSRGRLDTSLHPFSTGVRGDQRITTRYRETDFLDALLATAHETGHASYESGRPAAFDGLPVGESRNMSVHESQSLLFEKHLMISRAFLGAAVADVHDCLPDARALDADALWRGATRVAPTYIRVEADEIGYPLHVMLRHDIERALIDGDMEAEDVPEAWEAGMQAAFGLSVGDEHSKGCLQDIHWTDGAFGYFPSYTLGAVNAAQLMATLRARHPDWRERLAAGDTAFARDWLAATIWSRGSLLESQALMTEATGEGTNPVHLIAHLEARYVDERD